MCPSPVHYLAVRVRPSSPPRHIAASPLWHCVEHRRRARSSGIRPAAAHGLRRDCNTMRCPSPAFALPPSDTSSTASLADLEASVPASPPRLPPPRSSTTKDSSFFPDSPVSVRPPPSPVAMDTPLRRRHSVLGVPRSGTRLRGAVTAAYCRPDMPRRGRRSGLPGSRMRFLPVPPLGNRHSAVVHSRRRSGSARRWTPRWPPCTATTGGGRSNRRERLGRSMRSTSRCAPCGCRTGLRAAVEAGRIPHVASRPCASCPVARVRVELWRDGVRPSRPCLRGGRGDASRAIRHGE